MTWWFSQGHSSYITHLDWSPDNNFIMSNSGDYEILYCEYWRDCCPVYFRCCVLTVVYFQGTFQTDATWSGIVRSVKISIGQPTPVCWVTMCLVSRPPHTRRTSSWAWLPHTWNFVDTSFLVLCTDGVRGELTQVCVCVFQVCGQRVQMAPTSTLWWDLTTGRWSLLLTISVKFTCLPTHAPGPRWDTHPHTHTLFNLALSCQSSKISMHLCLFTGSQS